MEGVHEKRNPRTQELYPDGMAKVIANYLGAQPGIASARVTHLQDECQGLTDEILDTTDVMTWWGHLAHHEVSDENVERVQKRVWEGMGLVVMHSGHYSKILKRLLGTNCNLRWRDVGERERIWVCDPAHPIAEGVPPYFDIPHAEMYGEHFEIPQPDQLVFISWFEGGEVFRSGCCWHRGKGKIFYWRPGHETHPLFYNDLVMKVLANGVRWAAPSGVREEITLGHITEPLETIRSEYAE
jgi:trehalose utilization protein